MSQFETVPIPFIEIDGRLCLTRNQIEKLPYLFEFVEKFANSFEYDLTRDVLFYTPAGYNDQQHLTFTAETDKA